MDKTVYLAPGVPQELNYQCVNCGGKYGRQPSYCHGCGCNKLKKIPTCNR